MSHTSPDSPHTGDSGRRSATRQGRRIHPLTVIAVLLPVLTVAAVTLVQSPDSAADTDQGPSRTPLTSTALACPSGLGAGDQVSVANVEGATGEVALRGAGERDELRLRKKLATTRVRADEPVVVLGTDELAPGLLAGVEKSGAAGGVAAVQCLPPEPSQWFTGLGAGAAHASVLELVNPDAGPAVADITVLGENGVVDVPALRGVTVPGGTSVSLDLAEVVPERDELALRVLTSRGRLAGHVRDEVDELGAGVRSEDWLAAQREPAVANLLLGLPGGSGTRTLAVANPGDDEVRVSIKVLNEESAFTPVGVEEVRVAPQSVATVELDDVLQREIEEGARGLLVESSAPVTATLRSLVGDDLSHAVAAQSWQETGILLPEGGARLVLGAEGVGVARVRTWDAAGRRLSSKRIEVAPGRASSVALPAAAALLRVTGERTQVSGTVLAQGPGAVALVLRPLVLDGLVPAVTPALH